MLSHKCMAKAFGSPMQELIARRSSLGVWAFANVQPHSLVVGVIIHGVVAVGHA
jgi:hypothetical protein